MVRVLIIERDLNQSALYTEELSDDGYKVVCAANGVEALEIFNQQHPDLVITDILLPGMTGIEIMEAMLAAKPDLPIIIHSAYSSPKLDFAAGMARAYVVKSGDLGELKHHIRKVLPNHKTKLENNSITMSASDERIS